MNRYDLLIKSDMSYGINYDKVVGVINAQFVSHDCLVPLGGNSYRFIGGEIEAYDLDNAIDKAQNIINSLNARHLQWCHGVLNDSEDNGILIKNQQSPL